MLHVHAGVAARASHQASEGSRRPSGTLEEMEVGGPIPGVMGEVL